MRPTPGSLICGQVRIEKEADADVGGHVFGTALRARLEEDFVDVWLTVVERNAVPAQVDVSRFMASAASMLSLDHPALVPVKLVDREADFCVVGYQALPGAVSVARRLEGAGSTAGLVARVAVEAARGLAYLHKEGHVHGTLSPGNIMLWEKGVALWQHGIGPACQHDAIKGRYRALGGDVFAPEMRSGEAATPSSDVYAWGAVVAALATDCLGSAAIAAVEDGELGEGSLSDVVRAALSSDPQARPTDGLNLLERLHAGKGDDADVADGSNKARRAEVRELAGRYVDEIEGRRREISKPQRSPSASGTRRIFKRVAKESYPPELAPIAGSMVAPDKPVPDPFALPTGDVTPPQVRQESPMAVPTGAPEPMQITARRIEDEPSRRFNPDALTPPDGARLSELEPPSGLAPTPLPDALPDPKPQVVLPQLTKGTRPPSATPTAPPLAPAGTPVSTPRTPSPAAGTPAGSPNATGIGRIATKKVKRRVEPAAESAQDFAPPSPKLEELSSEDSGFGLSRPLLGAIDERTEAPSHGSHDPLAPVDPLDDVVGALAPVEPARSLPRPTTPAVATSARPDPLALDTSALDLDDGRASGPPSIDTAKPDFTPSSPAPMGRSLGTGLELDTGSGGRASSSSRPSSLPPRLETGPRPVVAAASASMEIDGRTRGPRGSTMAALLGFGATLLAIGVTVPVAQERGGLAGLLGMETQATSVAPQGDGRTNSTPGDTDTEPTPVAAAPSSCPKDTVAIVRGSKQPNVCIEAGEYPGLREIPTTRISLAEAAKACEDGGRRLCTANEWKQACRGSKGRRLPYKGNRVEGRCNDARTDGAGSNLSRSGARGACATPEGVYDLVGNVGEWVDGGGVMGGDATTAKPTCTTRRKPDPQERHEATGFRCCLTLAVEDEAPTPG